MVTFRFTALGRDGVQVVGEESFASREALERALGKRQLTLIKAKKIKGKGIRLNQLVTFVGELSRLVGSGVVLDRALQIIAEDSGDKSLNSIALRARESLKQGIPLSDAMAQIGRVDPLMIGLVRVGEATGELGQVLAQLDEHYQDAIALRKEVIAAMIYPCILAFLSLASLVALGVYVIPIFRDIFVDNPVPLPLGTRIVFAVSDWLVHYGAMAAVLLLILVMVAAFAWRHSESVRLLGERVMLRMPMIGVARVEFESAKLFRALGVMLRSGLPLAQSFEYAREALALHTQRAGIDEGIRRLRKGVTVTTAFDAIPYLPTTSRRLVNVGNETGKLPEMILRAAAILDRRVRTRTKALVALLDPLIIIAMGGMIGFVVVSMLLAVFSLSDIK